ncbi:MAG TPA: hypothetical protein VMK16_18190 [Acidimicrobiales bacterium]|nr:hypothetical protein [Acidimicrobiales bacterium]
MPPAPDARRFICTVCWRLRADGEHVDYCRCQPHDTDDSAPDRDIPCQLCWICALTVVHGHTRWMLVNCNECSTRARELNTANGRLLIPIGIHSIVNGVALRPSGDRKGLERQAQSFVGFTRSMFTSLDQLRAQGQRIVKARCHRLGLIGAELVDVDVYVAAARAVGYTEASSFNRYVTSMRRRD